MTQKSNQVRIPLDDQANQALADMMQTLKTEGKFVRVSPSRLASWVIAKFHTEYFEKHKAQIIHQYFDSKEYLKDLANKIDGSDDTEKVLSEALKQFHHKTQKDKHAGTPRKERPAKKSEPERV